MADAHHALLLATPAGEGCVRTLDLPASLARPTGMLVQIVHPDLPFLVDSVSMAVNRTGRTVHWIVHPLLRVSRDAQGQITEVADAADTPAHPDNGSRVVSCMLVKPDRLAADADGGAVPDHRNTLRDVQATVHDWRAMLSRVQLLNASFTALDTPRPTKQSPAQLAGARPLHLHGRAGLRFGPADPSSGSPSGQLWPYPARRWACSGTLTMPCPPAATDAVASRVLVQSTTSHAPLHRPPPRLAGCHQRAAAGCQRPGGGRKPVWEPVHPGGVPAQWKTFPVVRQHVARAMADAGW